MVIAPGTLLAERYRALRRLRREGLGDLFMAEDTQTGDTLAVKVLVLADDDEDVVTNSREAMARFAREARAAAAVQSEHVVRCLAVKEDTEHGLVLVFELLQGDSLLDRLKRAGPMPLDELHPIAEQLWMGIADIHSVGIIHRDIRPSHVILEQPEGGKTRVKIVNFGISKDASDQAGDPLTQQGQSVGVFSYMPPEQIGKAKTVDHRADIYACSTLLYQALSGKLPFTARNVLVLIEAKTKNDPRTLAEAMDKEVSPRLEAFFARGLARDPTKRFATATEALEAWRALAGAEG